MNHRFAGKRLTFADAKKTLRPLGLTLTKDTIGSGPTGSGEFRVNFRDGKEGTAYYTNDLDDAVATGKVMAFRYRGAQVVAARHQSRMRRRSPWT